MRIAGVLLAVILLVGCAAPAPEPTAAPSRTPTPTATPAPEALVPTGATSDVLTGLAAPWSVVPLENGSAFISERDSRRILEFTASGDVREIAVVADAVSSGEGGLLGLEVFDDFLYAYYTTASDNRVVRWPLTGGPGSYALGGDAQVILSGLGKAGNHNGGRIKVGPDGMLYVTVGDASDIGTSQNPASLNGKILRLAADGTIPADNPFPGSAVYSLGHRNPQGLAWDTEGRLWAAEFGQNTWDEINLIEPGGNYGWPNIEGVAGDPAYIDPVVQWSTDDASPSGLAAVGASLFMAGLGGERLWVIDPASGTSSEFFAGQFGRIRDAVAAPDGSLWIVTNNTDGRGSPRDGDDRIIRVELGPRG